MTRVWPYLLFALLSGALALSISLSPRGDPAQVTLHSFPSSTWQTLRYAWPKGQLQLQPLGPELAWMEWTETGKDAQRFLVGGSYAEVRERLENFRTPRILGSSSSFQDADHGLQNPERQLELTMKDGPNLSLAIGRRGFQSAEYFARSGDQVFLWDRRVPDLLENAPARLALKSLSFLNELERLRISYEGQDIQLSRQEGVWRDRQGAARPQLLAWIDTLSKAPWQSYTPRVAGQTPWLQLAFEGRSSGTLSFYRESATGGLRIELEGVPLALFWSKESWSQLENDLPRDTP